MNSNENVDEPGPSVLADMTLDEIKQRHTEQVVGLVLRAMGLPCVESLNTVRNEVEFRKKMGLK